MEQKKLWTRIESSIRAHSCNDLLTIILCSLELAHLHSGENNRVGACLANAQDATQQLATLISEFTIMEDEEVLRQQESRRTS